MRFECIIVSFVLQNVSCMFPILITFRNGPGNDRNKIFKVSFFAVTERSLILSCQYWSWSDSGRHHDSLQIRIDVKMPVISSS